MLQARSIFLWGYLRVRTRGAIMGSHADLKNTQQ
jgi:hypothetical protein